jgi:hypothetical protein
VGEKAVAEIAELLQREGLFFGAVLDEVDGVLRPKGGATPAAAGNGEIA